MKSIGRMDLLYLTIIESEIESSKLAFSSITAYSSKLEQMLKRYPKNKRIEKAIKRLTVHLKKNRK